MKNPTDPEQQSPPLVLLVDDDAGMRRLCQEILEREGCRVLDAPDAGAGISLAKEALPDVIIMDVMMPGVDGLEATRRLRSDPATDTIPIIMLSAKGGDGNVLAGLEAGADEYLLKPFTPKELVIRARSMVRLRRASVLLQHRNEMLGRQTYALTMILDFTIALEKTESMTDILDHTAAVAGILTGCRRVSIMLFDATDNCLRIRRSIGLDESTMSGLRIPVGEPIAGQVFAERRRLVINNKADSRTFGRTPDAEVCGGSPLLSTPMSAAEGVVGVLNVADRADKRPFTGQELEYLELISHHAASAIQTLLAREARDEARDSVVVALAKLAEHRDDDTGKHLDRIARFCLELARGLRSNPKYTGPIDDEFLRNIRRTSPLHDIGKVAIPDSILLKPGKLTPEEMTTMRTHVTEGADTLRAVLVRAPSSGYLKMAEEIAQGHHEWFDGGGYPDGLRGDQIPLSARIAAVADVYDALTTKRAYKEAISHEQARTVILEGAGKQFDPDVVAAFVEREPEILRLAIQLADSSVDWAMGDESSPGPRKSPALVGFNI
ncbi:MAG TPA: HD domain-containing phosphohydrolase [Phycisphaerae bacterium]|nr:HD domain-containing phosphohydrolase [Phycisphaerae bacterium]